MARTKLFTDPKDLEAKINNYFDKKKEDFTYKYDVVKSGIEAGKELKIKVHKPMHLIDLCVHLEITSNTLIRYINEFKDNEAIIDKIIEGVELTNHEQILLILARAYERIHNELITNGLNGLNDPGLAKILTGLTDTINVNSNVSIQALPVNISNNIIDLTDMDFEVLENKQTLALE